MTYYSNSSFALKHVCEVSVTLDLICIFDFQWELSVSFCIFIKKKTWCCINPNQTTFSQLRSLNINLLFAYMLHMNTKIIKSTFIVHLLFQKRIQFCHHRVCSENMFWRTLISSCHKMWILIYRWYAQIFCFFWLVLQCKTHQITSGLPYQGTTPASSSHTF